MDLVEQLTKVFKRAKYRGIWIEVREDKFHVMGQVYDTLNEAKERVDECCRSLKKSIR